MRIVELRAENVKQCPRCEEEKPLAAFYQDRSKRLGVGTYCKPCSVILNREDYHARRAWAKAIPAEKECRTCGAVKPASDFWRFTGALDGLQSECKDCRKARVRLARYGITQDEFDSLLAGQDGVCACCGLRSDDLVVDHCHSGGDIRGLLCSQCNTAIGLMADDPDRLIAAAAYLIRNEVEVTCASLS